MEIFINYFQIVMFLKIVTLVIFIHRTRCQACHKGKTKQRRKIRNQLIHVETILFTERKFGVCTIFSTVINHIHQLIADFFTLICLSISIMSESLPDRLCSGKYRMQVIYLANRVGPAASLCGDECSDTCMYHSWFLIMFSIVPIMLKSPHHGPLLSPGWLRHR